MYDPNKLYPFYAEGAYKDLKFRVIYCRQCRFCPVPSQIAGHLDLQHVNVPKQIRARIVEEVQKIPDVAQRPEDVIYPEPGEEDIPELKLYSNACRCLGTRKDGHPCSYTVPTIKKIQEHCRDEHAWVNEQTRGGNARKKQKQTPNRMWVDGQCCQQFFRTGAGWKKYFTVSGGKQGKECATVDEIVSQGERQLESHLAAVEADHQTQQVEADHHPYRANRWLRRAAWPHHLARYEKRELVGFVIDPQREPSPGPHRDHEAGSDVPDEEVEPALWRACGVTVDVIHQAQKMCDPKVTGLSALEFVNRRETGQVNNEKPFYGHQSRQTIQIYCRYFTRILCYIWRTHDDTEPSPPYRLTTRQQRCLRDLEEAIERYEGLPGHDRRQEMYNACLSWWIALLDHELKDHQDENAMVSGAAVLGWDGDGGIWRPAHRYTQVLSGIITVSRMLVIHHSHRERTRAIQRYRDHGYSDDDARQKARSHFEVVQEMVQRFMTLTTYDGKPSPMNHFFHLRTYGMSVSMNRPKDGVLSWHGDEVQSGGVRFSMPDLRAMVHGLVTRVRRQLEQELLLLTVDDASLPPLDLNHVYDNPGDVRDRWSFLKDGRNQFSVDGQRWLHGRVLRDPRLRRRFIDTSTLGSDRRPYWRPVAI